MRDMPSSFTKGMDTMDVWFDSGISWTGIEEQLKPEGFDTRNPLTEVYLEGSDQHRGWFQSSLLTSIAVRGKAPFANIITHGFVLDKDGIKMSKSVGNVISPLTVINGSSVSLLMFLLSGSAKQQFLLRTNPSSPPMAPTSCVSGLPRPATPEM